MMFHASAERLTTLTTVLLCAALTTDVTAQETPQQVFESVFGDAIKEVVATDSPDDDTRLAIQMVSALVRPQASSAPATSPSTSTLGASRPSSSSTDGCQAC